MDYQELCQKCKEFEKMAAGTPAEDMAERREKMERIQTVRLMLTEIKRLCDIVDAKYRGNKPGFFDFLTPSHSSLLRSLKKIRNQLEDVSKSLDRFNWL